MTYSHPTSAPCEWSSRQERLLTLLFSPLAAFFLLTPFAPAFLSYLPWVRGQRSA